MENNKNKAVIFANIVIGGIVILLALAIIYLWYRSYSQQIPINLMLIAISAGILLCSIFTLFIRDNWKVNIAAIVVSSVVAAYGVELVLFAIFTSVGAGAEVDKRSRIEVLEDFRADGVDAWPHVIPFLFTVSNGLLSGNNRLFPLSGISDKTIVFCNESGQYRTYESDEHGFNNPKGLYKEGNIKIALVGDSFTMGHCVMPGEDVANQIRNMGISSLNLGNGGNGPLTELGELKEFIEPVKPEIILWLYYEGNDLVELEKERKALMLMNYLKDSYSQNLLERQDEVDTALMKYVKAQWMEELQKNKIRHLTTNVPLLRQAEEKRENRLKVLRLWFLRNRLGLTSKTHKPHQIVVPKTQLPLFSEIMAAASKRSSSWGGKFYFVYLPTMERYVDDNNDGDALNRDDVLAILQKHDIPLIDFHEVLNEHPEPLSLTPFLGAHYNAEGYKLLSEFIVSQLRKDGLI